MHRFRKKSDAKRGEASAQNSPARSSDASSYPGPTASTYSTISQASSSYLQPLPSLPPVSDFRTSLILPDLTKRFTLLRTSTGDPVSLDDLKSRFAQQRATGTGHAISEEEEDMLLEALSRIRGSNAAASSRGTTSGSDSSTYVKNEVPSSPFSGSDFGHSSVRESSLSAATSSTGLHDSIMDGSSLSLSPSSRSTKRHSNNMFGGGFKDRSYIRKQTARPGGSNRSVLSTTPSETSGLGSALIDSYADTPRPVTPENATPSILSSHSSPSDQSSSMTRSPILSVASVDEDSSGASTLRFSKRLTNSQLKRMSTTLEKVIREIEEEAEDQVLVPRTPITNGMFTQAKSTAVTMDTDNSNEQVAHAITTVNDSAVTFSEANIDRPSSAGGFRSPSPFYAASLKSPMSRAMANSPVIPRSITPRNVDLEDQRSHSTTPRAASPTDRLIHTVPLSLPASSLFRHGSNASTTKEERRPTSPLSAFTFPKSSTGRSTPEPRIVAPSDGSPPTFSPTPWRRPVSPLTGSSFQAINGSRPGTPSNVTWTVGAKASTTKPLGRNGTITSSHSRNASTTSIGNTQEVAELKSAAKENLRAATRSPPTFNLVDRGVEPIDSKSKLNFNASQPSPSPLPNLGFDASALAHRAAMSPSPTREISNTTTSASSGSVNGSTGESIQRMRSPFITPPASPFSPKFKTNPLMVDPTSNSSRSSLASAGSSYHSWDEENNVGISFINTSDVREHVWHDIPLPPTSTNGVQSSNSHSRSGSRSKLNQDDPEYILRHATGLTKLDILTIQSKLLEAATMRAKTNETRSPSTLRRRRPSTAQSIQSFGGPSRTTSPAPQQFVGASAFGRSTENVAKASALLDSLADSIEKPVIPQKFMNMNEAEKEVAATDLGTSSPSRRNKDLADILFGAGEVSSTPVASEPHQPFHEFTGPDHENEKAEATDMSQSQTEIAQVAGIRNAQEPVSEAAGNSPPAMTPDPGDLVREVQKRAEVAMAQLQRSMQTTRSPVQNGAPRKRINRQDISSPTLVQSSTSIDKIPTFPTSPLQSPGPGPQRSGSKLSNGIRRLRNTLRSKPSTPNGEEVSPWANDAMTSPSNPTTHQHQHFANSSKPSTLSPANNGSFNGFRSTASISPPASAGPSLKTFMNRFRKKGSNDNQMEVEQRNGSSSFNSSLASSTSISPDERHGIPVPFSAPPTQIETFPRTNQYTVQSPILTRQTTDTATIHASQVSPPASPPPPTSPSDPAALRRFFDAAQDIGLGKVALDYLASVNPEWTPSTPTVIVTGNDSAKNSLEDNQPREDSLSPIDRVASPVSPASDFDHTGDLGRSRSLREHQVSPPVPRRVRELADTHGNSNNPIVRRTLIFPSANGSSTDLTTLVRKASKKAHRASAVSTHSNRSIHDRVPTPPPTKAKRQSMDAEPPVPILPSSSPWVGHAAVRNLSDINMEKTTSLHDSFYDMYTGDRTGSSQAHDLSEPPKTPVDEFMGDTEAGQAIEITEMANGETIWSIVNGLRADDAESVYQHRVSMASAFSEAPHDGDSGEQQLFFKEHARNLSKGSSRSNLGLQRKGTLTGGASRNRPETKVFYSSSAHIARLIEQLSRGADAGSFNIKPTKQEGGHSHSASLQSEGDAHWTVEERLDHMLGVVGTAS